MNSILMKSNIEQGRGLPVSLLAVGIPAGQMVIARAHRVPAAPRWNDLLPYGDEQEWGRGMSVSRPRRFWIRGINPRSSKLVKVPWPRMRWSST